MATTQNPALGVSQSRNWALDDYLPMVLIVAVLTGFGIVVVLVLSRVEDFSSESVVGLLAALVPGVLTVIIAALGYADRKRETTERRLIRESERYEKIVLGALDYFTKGSQRRNVGISAVQGAWAHTPELRPVFLPLLVNQAVYLLEESGQGEAKHERENLGRIVRLIMEANATDEFSRDWYRPLVTSIDRCLDRQAADEVAQVEGAAAERGISVDKKDLQRWKECLRRGRSLAPTE